MARPGLWVARHGSIAPHAPATVTALDLPGTTGNYFSTPDSAATSPGETIDLRAHLSLDDWTPAATNTIASKFNGNNSQRSWTFSVLASGALRFSRWLTGIGAQNADSTVATGFSDGTAHWVRAVLSTTTVKFYTSDDGESWSQLGTTVTVVQFMEDSTAGIEIGSISEGTLVPLAGVVQRFEIRNSVDGAVAAVFDPSAVTRVGAHDPASFDASTGETWTGTGTGWDWVEV